MDTSAPQKTRMASATSRHVVTVVSDLHLNSPWACSTERKELLAHFLESMTDPSTHVHTLVLLGDIVELWLCKLESEPIEAQKVLKAAELDYFVRGVRSIQKNGIRVIYVRGNHDMPIHQKDLDDSFGQGVVELRDEFVSKGVRYEHGHRYDLFNTPDPLYNQPIGYWITRAAASGDHGDEAAGSWIENNAKKLNAIFGQMLSNVFSDELVDFMNTAVLFSALAKQQQPVSILSSKKALAAAICAHPVRVSSNKYAQITVGDILEMYKGFCRRHWEGSKDGSARLWALFLGSLGHFEWWFRHMNERVIIFGHTHGAKLEEHQFEEKKRIYANTGSWIDAKNPTFVEVEENEWRAVRVSLKEFRRGEHVTLKQMVIDELDISEPTGFRHVNREAPHAAPLPAKPKPAVKSDVLVISEPTNFRHVQHVGVGDLASKTGENFPKEFRELFERAGMFDTEELQDESSSEFMMNVIKRCTNSENLATIDEMNPEEKELLADSLEVALEARRVLRSEQ